MNIDPRDGRPCIVYLSEQAGYRIKVAWRNTDGTYEYDEWLAPGQIMRLSGAMLPNGMIVVAMYWYDSTQSKSQLWAVWRSPSGTWTSQIVDDEGKDNGYIPILKLDSSFNPWIIYTYMADENYQSAKQVRLARYNGSGWDIQVMGADWETYANWYMSLCFDNSDPVILYSRNELMTIFKYSAGEWTSRFVDSALPSTFESPSMTKWRDSLNIIAGKREPLEVFRYVDNGGGFDKNSIYKPLSDVCGIFSGNPALAGNSDFFAVTLDEAVNSPYNNRRWFFFTDGVSWKEEVIYYGSAFVSGSDGLIITGQNIPYLAEFRNLDHDLWLGTRVVLDLG